MRIKINLPTITEGTWSGVDSEYSAFFSGSVEQEVGDFLYGMVRILKPNRIFETGTHLGISACYMGLALRDNKKGKLTTVENVPSNIKSARELLKEHSVSKYVEVLEADVRQIELDGEFDLLFLDSEPQYRFDELTRFYPHLRGGGYAFIHDLHAHASQENDCIPFGKMPTELLELVQQDNLRAFSLPNPRGMMGFYKTSDKDYRWKGEILAPR
jgi:predicted O-methyltransferase YrrM